MIKKTATDEAKAGKDNPPVDRKGGRAAGKFLTFFLGGKEYGLEILKVQEIIRLMDITPVPRTPDFIRGVINLRGKMIPVVDLRLKFKMESIGFTHRTCIIVVHTNGVEMGIIVDRVSEVLDVSSEDIEETPSFGVSVNTDYILGMGKAEGKVRILLDIDKVLSTEEVSDIAKTLQ